MPSNTTIALVTGANAGLGKAIATILAEKHGYHVIIGSRNAASGEEAAKCLQGRGFLASSVQLDVTSDESITAAVKSIADEYGRIDVLVNNAGVHYETPLRNDEYDFTTRELYTRTFQANLIGAAILTDQCLPLIERAKTPRIVFVSSRGGSQGHCLDKTTPFYGVEMPAYKASKAALNSLGLHYMTKLDRIGAMVNMVCPGLVATKMVGFHPDGRSPEAAAGRVVEMATLSEGGPTGTFIDWDGPVPW